MATYSSALDWRIPGMGEPGGLPSMGLHRVRHDWSDLAEAICCNKQKGKIIEKQCVCVCVCVCITESHCFITKTKLYSNIKWKLKILNACNILITCYNILSYALCYPSLRAKMA